MDPFCSVVFFAFPLFISPSVTKRPTPATRSATRNLRKSSDESRSNTTTCRPSSDTSRWPTTTATIRYHSRANANFCNFDGAKTNRDFFRIAQRVRLHRNAPTNAHKLATVLNIPLSDFPATDILSYNRNRQRVPLAVLLVSAVASLSALGAPEALGHTLIICFHVAAPPTMLAVAVRSKLFTTGALPNKAWVPLPRHQGLSFCVCRKCRKRFMLYTVRGVVLFFSAFAQSSERLSFVNTARCIVPR